MSGEKQFVSGRKQISLSKVAVVCSSLVRQPCFGPCIQQMVVVILVVMVDLYASNFYDIYVDGLV